MAFISPFSDDNMVWNKNKKQYELTRQALITYLNEPLTNVSDAEFDILSQEISDDIYLFIYSYGLLSMKYLKEYIIGSQDFVRDVIQRAMIYHFRATIRSGLALLKDQHGVNIEKGFAIKLKEIRGDVTIASQSKQILLQSGILTQGLIPYVKQIPDNWWDVE